MEAESKLACKSEEVEGSVQSKGSSSSQQKLRKTGSVAPILAFALIVCIGGVLGGYSHGFPSPTLLDLQIAYERGDKVTAFPSSSIYVGIFGVSVCKPAPPPSFWDSSYIFSLSLCIGYWSSWWPVWGLRCRTSV